MLLSNWPVFTLEEIEAVATVLRSEKVNYWSGNEGKSFEREFAAWCGSRNAIAMANGSLALSASYQAIGLGPGDELITTPRTFIATSSSAVLLKCIPVFADVDRDSGAITSDTIAPLITKKTKAISVVHLAGWPADMPSICSLASSHGIAVVEDCAQAHGAQIQVEGSWQSVGSFAEVSAWSFCQDKIMSTGGEGGLVTTNSEELFENIWSYKDHGKTLEAVFAREHPQGFRWVHERFGSNFRLTELQSAIGRIQLRRMKEWNGLRTRNALILINALADCLAIRVPVPPAHLRHAWYKFHCFVRPDNLVPGWNRDRIAAEISALGYPARQGSCSEIYLEKCFKESGLAPTKRLPVARELGETSLMFLVHPTITKEQMEGYADAILSVLIRAAR